MLMTTIMWCSLLQKDGKLSEEKESEQFIVMRSKRRGSYSKGMLFIRTLREKQSLDQFITEQENLFLLKIEKQFLKEEPVSINAKVMGKKIFYKGNANILGSGYLYGLYVVHDTFAYVLFYSRNILEKYDDKKEILTSLNSFRFLNKEEIEKTKVYRLYIFIR